MSAADIRALFEARRDIVAKPMPFDVPGFGSVFVKVLSAKAAADNADALAKPENAGKHMVLTAAMVICDEVGEPVFNISNPDDIALLEGVDPKTLSTIFTKSRLENAQSAEGVEAAGNV